MNYKKIDSILKEKGMSRRQLAKKIGMSPNTLTSAFVRESEKSFSMEAANKIADILNVNLEDIVKFDIEHDVTLVNLAPSENDPDYSAKQELALKFINSLRARRREEQFETMRIYFDWLNEKGRDKAIEMILMLSKIDDYKIENGDDQNGQS